MAYQLTQDCLIRYANSNRSCSIGSILDQEPGTGEEEEAAENFNKQDDEQPVFE